MKVVILGCGNVGMLLAKQLRMSTTQNYEVVATSRSRTRFAEIEATGAEAKIFDLWAPETHQESFADAEAIVFLLAPGGDRERLYGEGIDLWLESLEAFGHIERNTPLLFVTSTAVYDGYAAGTVIDETQPAHAVSSRSKPLLRAEQCLGEHFGESFCAVRFSGLYSKSRGPFNFLDSKLQAGETLRGSGSKILNLIHMRDAAGLLKSVLDTVYARPTQERTEIAAPNFPSIVLGCDGQGRTRAELYGQYCRFKRYPEPRFAEPSGGLTGVYIKPTWSGSRLSFPKYRPGA